MNLPSRIAWASAFFISVALFYAPLAYGCARPDMLPTLYGLSIAGIVFGVVSFAMDGSWRTIPKTVFICATALLIQGWWVAHNPVIPTMIEANGGMLQTPLHRIFFLSRESMELTTVLLGVFLVLCGLFQHAALRRFILLSAAGSGILTCVVGVTLKTVGAPLMRYIWKPLDIYWNDFAFFRYHGNAGAFLNLVWPLILVFTRRAYTPTGGVFRKVVWTIASVLCAAALVLNASKAALVIGLLILPWPFMTRLLRLNRATLIFFAVIGVLAIAGALTVSSKVATDAAFERLTNRHEVSDSLRGRIDSYEEDLSAVPEAGLFGYGPGMFQVAFPYQDSPMRNVGLPMRDYAHEDYIQTVIEWGWFGTFWWSLLVFGGLYRAFHVYGERAYFTSKTERHLLLAAILGVLGTLAQASIDFPLQIASLRLFFLVLLALCWASPGLLTIPERKSRREAKRLYVPAALAAKG